MGNLVWNEWADCKESGNMMTNTTFIILDNMSDLGNCGQIEISQGFSARKSCSALVFLNGGSHKDKAERKDQGPWAPWLLPSTPDKLPHHWADSVPWWVGWGQESYNLLPHEHTRLGLAEKHLFSISNSNLIIKLDTMNGYFTLYSYQQFMSQI